VFHITDNPDYLQPSWFTRTARIDATAQRILSAEKTPPKSFIDNSYTRRLRSITIREDSSAAHANSQRLKIIRANHAVKGYVGLFRNGSSFDVELAGKICFVRRQAVTDRCSMNSRQRLHLLDQVVRKITQLIIFPISLTTQREAHTQDPLGVDSKIYLSHTPKTLDEQTGAGNQHHRQRQFNNHQHSSTPAFARALSCASSSVTKGFDQIQT